MIVFIIPFVSKQVSKNWNLAVALLQGTLDSLANQSSQDFRVIVSCHEIPPVHLKRNSQALSFLSMEYSPFDDFYHGRSQRDRWVKCCRALLSLKDVRFKYCMALDADDRIDQKLVAFLQEQSSVDAWIIDKGYQVNYPSSRAMTCTYLDKI